MELTWISISCSELLVGILTRNSTKWSAEWEAADRDLNRGCDRLFNNSAAARFEKHWDWVSGFRIAFGFDEWTSFQFHLLHIQTWVREESCCGLVWSTMTDNRICVSHFFSLSGPRCWPRQSPTSSHINSSSTDLQPPRLTLEKTFPPK